MRYGRLLTVFFATVLLFMLLGAVGGLLVGLAVPQQFSVFGTAGEHERQVVEVTQDSQGRVVAVQPRSGEVGADVASDVTPELALASLGAAAGLAAGSGAGVLLAVMDALVLMMRRRRGEPTGRFAPATLSAP